MFVSSGFNKSYWRNTRGCKLRRNGSFIDIVFDDDGVMRSIGIVESELKQLIEIQGHGKEIDGVVYISEPADVGTALAEFLMRRSVVSVLSRPEHDK